MVKDILPINDPRLKQVSKPVKKVDKKLLRLVHDLGDTLKDQKDPKGVGLAAPQIGALLQMFVVNNKGKIATFINPKIIAKSKKTNDPKKAKGEKRKAKNDFVMEGCLSLPHIYGPVKRAWRIKMKYQKLNIKDMKLKNVIEVYSGFIAQAIQHEIDHLNGKTFVERLLEQKRRLFKLEGKEWVVVELG